MSPHSRYQAPEARPEARDPSSPRKTKLILALGNILRADDGVGQAVISTLARQTCLPEAVDLIDGGVAGLKILSLLEGYDQVVIIDAADAGLRPGRWIRLDLDSLLQRLNYPAIQGTLHAAGLEDALVVGRDMEILPEKLSIYLMQPLDTQYHIGLSPVVRRSIPTMCQAIAAEVNRDG